MQNEIETLRQEVQTLKEQQRLISDELVKQRNLLQEIKGLASTAATTTARATSNYISRYLNDTASRQTAEFIIENMQRVKSFGGTGGGYWQCRYPQVCRHAE